ncbi:DUF4167 domain-containing protein [Sneathiella glossodoripedis]|uniref:DUF4167 domain-containing protein n=1 Tax=Sneathiella glossodoripedis TaxID=418853 RepID=UPI000687BBE8|nr:DUF4167 domain-containing protein [Sneathiella glossodoripedis]
MNNIWRLEIVRDKVPRFQSQVHNVRLELNKDGLNFIMRVSGNRRPRGGRSNSGNGRSGSSGGRGNSGNNRRSNNGNRSYDSNGPDGKIRGSATQVYDKYVSLGRDAQTSGDHVAAENYYQHAEHYYRIMLANNLVKLDRQTEQEEATSEDTATVEDGAKTEALDPAVEVEEKTKSENEADDANAEKTPIIIDLSDPDRSDFAGQESEEEVKTDENASSAESEEQNEGDEEVKPKTKRRVSRTRGLRRRTSRKKSSDEESDEPQSA